MNIAFVPKTELTLSQNSSMKISPSKAFAEGMFNPMPVGEKEGDLMYWDPNAGEGSRRGAWVIIEAPDPSDEEYKYLRFGENLQWGPSEFEEGVSVNDMLRWDGEKWAILPAPTSGSSEDPVFLKYTGGPLFWGEGGGGGSELPNGTELGDILYWNPEVGDGGSWVVLTAPQDSSISIKKFDICENGQPKEYNMLVWDQG
jgi:hypothetical protein